MAPYREKKFFLQNPWIFGNFRKLGANSEKIEKIASRDSLEHGIVAVMGHFRSNLLIFAPFGRNLLISEGNFFLNLLSEKIKLKILKI